MSALPADGPAQSAGDGPHRLPLYAHPGQVCPALLSQVSKVPCVGPGDIPQTSYIRRASFPMVPMVAKKKSFRDGETSGEVGTHGCLGDLNLAFFFFLSLSGWPTCRVG